MTSRTQLPDFDTLAKLKGFVPARTLATVLRISPKTLWAWHQKSRDPRKQPLLPPPITVARVRGWNADVIHECLNVTLIRPGTKGR